MKGHFKSAVRRASLLAASSLLAGGWLLPNPAQAADKYDSDLERRVETLERELNILGGDKKGKNMESVEVPTFVRAAKNVQELVFTGELRFRYAYDNVDSQTTDAETQSSRDRFRFRLFADYKLSNNFFAGAAVQTSVAADSGNTTYSEGFDNYSLYLWRAFIGYRNDYLTVTVGKLPNPFYANTEMLWDADISPTGITEQFKLPVSPTFELGFNAGQFIFYDNAENAQYNPRTNAAGAANGAFVNGGDNSDDAYLLYQQIVATFKPTNDFAITAAGGYFIYAGHGGTNSPGAVNPAPAGGGTGNNAQAGNVLQNVAAFNSANATRNLSIGTASADVKVGLGALKVKLYSDLAYNFKGGSRDSEEYGQPGKDGFNDKFAFSTGVTVGSDYQIKKAGDYLLLAEYRQVGLGSIDPNLNDSDWNLSRLGFRGIKTAASYGFYPWLIGTVSYYAGNNLGDEKNVNIGVANANATQTLQVDLTARF
jgi:hypothetical protein